MNHQKPLSQNEIEFLRQFAQKEIKSNRDFWIPKIEKNMQRDREVTEKLTSEGWIVLRFWGNEIKKDLLGCADKIEAAVRSIK